MLKLSRTFLFFRVNLFFGDFWYHFGHQKVQKLKKKFLKVFGNFLMIFFSSFFLSVFVFFSLFYIISRIKN